MNVDRLQALLDDAIDVRDQLLEDAQRDGLLGTTLFAEVMDIAESAVDAYRRLLTEASSRA